MAIADMLKIICWDIFILIVGYLLFAFFFYAATDFCDENKVKKARDIVFYPLRIFRKFLSRALSGFADFIENFFKYIKIFFGILLTFIFIVVPIPLFIILSYYAYKIDIRIVILIIGCYVYFYYYLSKKFSDDRKKEALDYVDTYAFELNKYKKETNEALEHLYSQTEELEEKNKKLEDRISEIEYKQWREH